MKKFALRLTGTLFLVFTFGYLIGSFYNVSFDLREWTEPSRYGVSISVALLTVVSLFAIAISLDEKQDAGTRKKL